MSDDEDYEYEYGSDENYDYGSEAEEQDETAIEIENAFYEADGTFHTLHVWSVLTTKLPTRACRLQIGQPSTSPGAVREMCAAGNRTRGRSEVVSARHGFQFAPSVV